MRSPPLTDAHCRSGQCPLAAASRPTPRPETGHPHLQLRPRRGCAQVEGEERAARRLPSDQVPDGRHRRVTGRQVNTQPGQVHALHRPHRRREQLIELRHPQRLLHRRQRARLRYPCHRSHRPPSADRHPTTVNPYRSCVPRAPSRADRVRSVIAERPGAHGAAGEATTISASAVVPATTIVAFCHGCSRSIRGSSSAGHRVLPCAVAAERRTALRPANLWPGPHPDADAARTSSVAGSAGVNGQSLDDDGAASGYVPSLAWADRPPRLRSHAARSASPWRSAASSGLRPSHPTQLSSAPRSSRYSAVMRRPP